MHIRRSQLLFLGVLLVSTFLWYVGGGLGLEGQLASLASQPHVNTAFQDPDTGKSDALLTLISFSLLTPMAAGVLLIALVFLVKALATVLVSLRVPSWLSAPAVGMSVLALLYTMSDAWLPPSLYALGIVARAYFVYSYGFSPMVH
jgi:hypothetical protein